jgi:hypothetical protein
MPNHIVDSDKVFEIVGPAFNMVIGAFVGLLGGLSLNANARDAKPPAPPEVDAPEPADDDGMAPWEKYRNDLRYDANGDGVVDEADFPDWRNPGA